MVPSITAGDGASYLSVFYKASFHVIRLSHNYVEIVTSYVVAVVFVDVVIQYSHHSCLLVHRNVHTVLYFGLLLWSHSKFHRCLPHIKHFTNHLMKAVKQYKVF